MSYKIGMIAFFCPPLPTFSESTVTKVGKFSRTLLDKQHLLHTIDIVGVPGTPVRVSGGDLCAAEAPTDAAAETAIGKPREYFLMKYISC